jgi:bacteriorhodopsin
MQVGRGSTVQGASEPLGVIVAFLIFILAMLFVGDLMSLISPSYKYGYYAAAMLAIIGMILYLILYFRKYS